ncbi:AraC family transcriptional regulator [Balneatrix alpica]|uniref:AraC family transcriptional regulator n=1 Tax=Balneatrix alpica TaxID=75684 RepID=A0ABV5ZDU8_9GAMM|nr:AraC family transcriptional regulator [Balneatrix alpica]
MRDYQLLRHLQKHKAQLLQHTQLDNGMGLAHWYNSHDRVEIERPLHHTLSLYVNDGYESYRQRGQHWFNGGGPDHFCLMPRQQASCWDIRGPLEFVHLYFTDQHLRQLAEQVWDKSPNSLRLDEKTFAQDARITSLYRHFVLTCHWQANEDRLLLEQSSQLLLTHLLQHYSQYQWQTPRLSGGLAPYLLQRLRDYIEAHLASPLTLPELAQVCGLSEYHFARMFKHSLGVPPHQYVLQRRLTRAQDLLRSSSLSLTDIAQHCGFASSSHFSHRFRQQQGCSPSQWRLQQSS